MHLIFHRQRRRTLISLGHRIDSLDCCHRHWDRDYLRARVRKRIEQHSLNLAILLLQGLGGGGADANVALWAPGRCRCCLVSKPRNTCCGGGRRRGQRSRCVCDHIGIVKCYVLEICSSQPIVVLVYTDRGINPSNRSRNWICTASIHTICTQ